MFSVCRGLLDFDTMAGFERFANGAIMEVMEACVRAGYKSWFGKSASGLISVDNSCAKLCLPALFYPGDRVALMASYMKVAVYNEDFGKVIGNTIPLGNRELWSFLDRLNEHFIGDHLRGNARLYSERWDLLARKVA